MSITRRAHVAESVEAQVYFSRAQVNSRFVQNLLESIRTNVLTQQCPGCRSAPILILIHK
jgi:hypothetical protein